MTQDERGFQNIGRSWTLPNRDLDLLADIDLLSCDPKNLEFIPNLL
jgi:hypothetical protein